MSDDEYTDDDSASDAPNDDGLDGKTLYEVLGVAKEATPTEIKKAYHRMALKLHPDKNACPRAASAVAVLVESHAVLTDPVRRAILDARGAPMHAWPANAHPFEARPSRVFSLRFRRPSLASVVAIVGIIGCLIIGEVHGRCKVRVLPHPHLRALSR